jgi:serine/threonine protein kinase
MQIMAKLDHDHIVQFIGICIDDGKIKIITAWREIGSLHAFLNERTGLTAMHLLTYCSQIANVSWV